MKSKLLIYLLFSAFLSGAPAASAELKPYQKEALRKLEELHGGMWPMVRHQFEGVISGSSEAQAKAIVKMVSDARGNAADDSASGEVENAEAGGSDAWEMAQAIREDLEKQIKSPYDAFVEHVAQLGVARHAMADRVRDGIFKAEKGARLNGVRDMFTHNTFVTNKSVADGLEELRLAREKLFESKKYHKVTLPSGNAPDNTSAVRAIITDGAERIMALNNQYAKIAAEIKKRIDNIPLYGPEKSKQVYDALVAEREGHNQSLSAQAAQIADEVNRKIAAEDRALFDWIIKPLREAQPQNGPVFQN